MSFRDVEDLLAERGIIVSYKTIRKLFKQFGQPTRKDHGPIQITCELKAV